eukprot:g6628.t1
MVRASSTRRCSTGPPSLSLSSVMIGFIRCAWQGRLTFRYAQTSQWAAALSLWCCTVPLLTLRCSLGERPTSDIEEVFFGIGGLAPFFEAMLRHNETGQTLFGRSVDQNGRLFVDRSGFLFEYVLEYLRTGYWLLGDRGRNRTFLDALRAEALFYGLDGPVPEIFTAEVSEYFSIWSADDGHEIIFLISLEDDINDPSAFQASFVPESISGCSGHAGEHCSQNPEKRSNDQNAHLAHKYPVQVKLPGGCVKTLYAEAVDGMSAADIARKFIDQNCLKPGFVKPLEWVVGAIWENARIRNESLSRQVLNEVLFFPSPDETFFHTLAMNSHFCRSYATYNFHFHHTEGHFLDQSSQRYTDFPTGSPPVLTLKEVPLLTEVRAFHPIIFARKFDASNHSSIRSLAQKRQGLKGRFALGQAINRWAPATGSFSKILDAVSHGDLRGAEQQLSSTSIFDTLPASYRLYVQHAHSAQPHFREARVNGTLWLTERYAVPQEPKDLLWTHSPIQWIRVGTGWNSSDLQFHGAVSVLSTLEAQQGLWAAFYWHLGQPARHLQISWSSPNGRRIWELPAYQLFSVAKAPLQGVPEAGWWLVEVATGYPQPGLQDTQAKLQVRVVSRRFFLHDSSTPQGQVICVRRDLHCADGEGMVAGPLLDPCRSEALRSGEESGPALARIGVQLASWPGGGWTKGVGSQVMGCDSAYFWLDVGFEKKTIIGWWAKMDFMAQRPEAQEFVRHVEEGCPYRADDVMKPETAVTIFVCEFDGGVVMGADSRTSTGQYVANRASRKISKVHDKIFVCRCGSAADTQALTTFVVHYLGQHAVELGKAPTKGGQVYSIPLGGARVRVPWACDGSGSGYIKGFIDANYRPGMSKAECVEFVQRAISLALTRDGSSGGMVRTLVITKDKVEETNLEGNKLPFGPM